MPEQTYQSTFAMRLETPMEILFHVFNTEIPRCVKTAEASLNGESPIKYAPNAESSIAYEKFAKEMVKLHEKETAKPRHQSIR